MTALNAFTEHLRASGLLCFLVGAGVPFLLAPCVAYLCRRAGWTS